MNKIFSKIKRQWRKIKYLDKTQLSYFVITGFIGAFCLFTGGTYSYFTITRNLSAATITIAKLNYNLSSTTSGYTDGSISVPAGGTTIVELTLESLNNIETKYALNYNSLSPDVKVYYSENLKNNMQGTIGATGSDIAMRVVIVNNGAAAATVNFTVNGGYVKNTLGPSNITEGYFEADVTLRTTLLNENMDNALVNQDLPPQNGEYVYFRTQCNENVNATWDNTNWKLDLGEVDKQIACDVYFKKMANDLETYYGLVKKDGTVAISQEAPNETAYTFSKAECNTETTATWNATSKQLELSNLNDKTICIGYFNEN